VRSQRYINAKNQPQIIEEEIKEEMRVVHRNPDSDEIMI